MIPFYVLAIENDDDREFLAMLYERYNRLMYREIHQILGNTWATEDVLQSTVIRLIDKVGVLRTLDRDHLVNYIITASKNQARNYIRDNRKHDGFSFDECFDVPDRDNNRDEMEFRLIHMDELRRLPQMWDQLDKRSRYVLESYYILDLSSAELAEELHIKPESVRMALTRARKNAFQLMEGKTK